MARDRFTLAEKTRTELLEIAEVDGVKLAPADNKGTIIDKILGVEPQTQAMPPEQVERKKMPDTPDVPLGALYTLQGERVDQTARRWKLRIFESETDRGPVDLVVNGYNIRVPRNVEVIVLEPYIKVLEEAVISTFTMDPDTKVKTPRIIPQFAYQATPL